LRYHTDGTQFKVAAPVTFAENIRVRHHRQRSLPMRKERRQSAGMIGMTMTEDNGRDRRQIPADLLSIIEQSESLPGIEENGGRWCFNQSGKAVLGNEPSGSGDAVFTKDGDAGRHLLYFLFSRDVNCLSRHKQNNDCRIIFPLI
jgi:hypothetical protein